jgi:hypothetical protein
LVPKGTVFEASVLRGLSENGLQKPKPLLDLEDCPLGPPRTLSPALKREVLPAN